MNRHSPIRHKVRSHRRRSKQVDSFWRGSGNRRANPERVKKIVSDPDLTFKLEPVKKLRKLSRFPHMTRELEQIDGEYKEVLRGYDKNYEKETIIGAYDDAEEAMMDLYRRGYPIYKVSASARAYTGYRGTEFYRVAGGLAAFGAYRRRDITEKVELAEEIPWRFRQALEEHLEKEGFEEDRRSRVRGRAVYKRERTVDFSGEPSKDQIKRAIADKRADAEEDVEKWFKWRE